jgi:hypothetical protein
MDSGFLEHSITVGIHFKTENSPDYIIDLIINVYVHHDRDRHDYVRRDFRPLLTQMEALNP